MKKNVTGRLKYQRDLSLTMTSAMDREFYEQASRAWSLVRHRDMVESVLHGIDRVSQLTASMQSISEESKATLQVELDREVSWLRANTAELRTAIAAEDLGLIVSERERRLVVTAEQMVRAETESKMVRPYVAHG